MTPAIRCFGPALLVAALSSATSAPLAIADPWDERDWSARVLLLGSTGSLFYRVSESSDIGVNVSLTWRNDSDESVQESPTDPDRAGTDDHEGSDFDLTVAPEWRSWNDIWGSNDALAVRSYWGVRLQAGLGQSSSRDVSDDLSQDRERESEGNDWSTGLALTLGTDLRVWESISLSAAVAPIDVTYSYSHNRYTEVYEQGPPSSDTTVTKTESTRRDTDVRLRATPSIYLVVAW